MEEDIKILEEIKYQKIIRNKQIEDDIYDNEVLMAQYEERISEIQAIENLINRNKELEEENNRKVIGRIDAIKIEDLEEVLSPYYIPKSKVKKMIEELPEDNARDYWQRKSLQKLLED